MKLKMCTMALRAIFLVVFLLFGCSGGGNGSDNTTQAPIGEETLTIELGEATIVKSSTVPASGAIITVSTLNDPLDGLEIDIPDGAYPVDTAFTISHNPILTHAGNPHFNPVTPLITIENGGEYADKIMVLKIPVTIEDGFHYMAFYYDETIGRLEGIPELSHDETSLTIAIRHYSKVVVNKIELAKELIEDSFDSGYRVMSDNWGFGNYGTYLTPEGMCSGMSTTSLYYYTMEKVLKGADDLYWSFFGRDPLWGVDDEDSIKLTSLVQYYEETDLVLVEEYVKQKALNKSKVSDVWSYFMFIHGLKVTGQPQYAAIYNEDEKIGHALVIYKKEGDRLFIADPNAPTDDTVTLDFTWLVEDPVATPIGKWAPFEAQWNVGSAKVDFTKAYYFGQSALVNWTEMAELFDELKDGVVGGNHFPEYTLTVVDKDTDGNDVEYPLSPTYVAQNEVIKIKVASLMNPADFDPDITAHPTGSLLEVYGTDEVEITLNEGLNEIGLHIRHQTDKVWADFQYVDISYDPSACTPVCSTPIIADSIVIPGYNDSYNVTIAFNNTFKMCSKEVDDPTSMNKKTMMLFFYQTDGTGSYAHPSPMASGGYEFASAFLDTAYDTFTVSMSPLADYNSYTYKYFDPESVFGFDVKNFESSSYTNEYDFLWINVRLTPSASEIRTIINTESVDSTGCYPAKD